MPAIVKDSVANSQLCKNRLNFLGAAWDDVSGVDGGLFVQMESGATGWVLAPFFCGGKTY